jgi:hypothetical protein
MSDLYKLSIRNSSDLTVYNRNIVLANCTATTPIPTPTNSSDVTRYTKEQTMLCDSAAVKRLWLWR